MRLVAIEDVKKYEMLPIAWISFGKKEVGHLLSSPYLKIVLPLFILKWQYSLWTDVLKFGWYNPVIFFFFPPYGIKVHQGFVFHSDFMGEVMEIHAPVLSRFSI